MSYLDDPRVFFAAERTLLAWNRTAVALMGFGFIVERFGLFLHVVLQRHDEPFHRGVSLWIGVAFVMLGAGLAVFASVQYRRVLKTLGQAEIPKGYWVNLGVATNLAIALLGLALAAYIVLS